MQKATSLFALLLFSLFGHAQTVRLTDGISEKAFPASYYFELSTKSRSAKGKDCCGTATYYGRIKAIEEDSIRMELHFAEIANYLEHKEINRTFKAPAPQWTAPIARRDIHNVRVFKTQKSRKQKFNRFAFGGILLFTGAATALNTFAVSKNGTNRENLLYSAAAQASVGIGLMIFNAPRSYQFKETDEPWRFEALN